jgi:hypothetical protein
MNCVIFHSKMPRWMVIIMQSVCKDVTRSYVTESDLQGMRKTMNNKWSHASYFGKTFCCKCHKGEVYIALQNFTSTLNKYILEEVKFAVKS